MATEGKTKIDPDAIADADLSLRSLSRMFAEALARIVARPDEQIRTLAWGETQLTARQRRLDRSLHIEIGRNHCRLLHIEWTMRLNERVRERTAEYHLLSAIAARRDARRQRKRGLRQRLISVDTVVVVLTGRVKPWPRFGTYRTSRKGKPFVGIRFRIEPVYQRTVAELESKGSLFWLAFVPLAKDADEEKLGRTLARVRHEGTEAEFVEIVATMLSMARIKKDRPEFVDVIRSRSVEEAMRHPWYEDGRERGLLEGRLEGQINGLGPLVYLFERRLGRPLRDIERQRIASRLTTDGPETLGAVVIDLSKNELAAWLKPRKSQKSRAA